MSFFGEQLGCKIFVEDIYAESTGTREKDKLDALPEYLARRLPQAEGSVDGILCWDLMDHLSRPAAQVLAKQLTRVLRPDGTLLAFFGSTQSHDAPTTPSTSSSTRSA